MVIPNPTRSTGLAGVGFVGLDDPNTIVATRLVEEMLSKRVVRVGQHGPGRLDMKLALGLAHHARSCEAGKKDRLVALAEVLGDLAMEILDPVLDPFTRPRSRPPAVVPLFVILGLGNLGHDSVHLQAHAKEFLAVAFRKFHDATRRIIARHEGPYARIH